MIRSSNNSRRPILWLTIVSLFALSVLVLQLSGNSQSIKQAGSQDVPQSKEDNDGHTSLHFASADGDLVNMRRLFSEHASVNAKNRFGETPLHWAAYAGKLEAVRLLLERGASCNIQNNFGENPSTFGSGQKSA